MPLVSIAIGLFISILLSVVAFGTVSLTLQKRQQLYTVSAVEQVANAVKEYAASNCMSSGYTPSGSVAPSCTASSWPSSIPELQNAGFLPNTNAFSQMPFSVVSISQHSSRLELQLSPEQNCRQLTDYFVNAFCSTNNTLNVVVTRNDNSSAWSLVDQGNFTWSP